ncbi:hypothetical protein ACIQAC_33505 [Streptomyces sp. NPDC088387]|uniref:hypothetical protein n=1 Tax=Streptomyces sp. NPDC088387 TaxID=3365859 RepID=UPI003808B943
MLRIIDARTGDPADAAPVRRGLTRVETRVSGYDSSSLRVLLVADLLVRALELGGTPVWALLRAERQPAELRAGAAALGIRPFEEAGESGLGAELAPGAGSGQAPGLGLGEAQVLHVAAADEAPAPGGALLAVAPVSPAGPPAGTDPSVLRLALLSTRRNVPVRLDAATLEEAHDTLARWRGAVAGWARQPSRPIPEEVRTRLRSAWEDDLDVPGVLRVLRRVEADPDLPEGARFETFAYTDRLLGLELVRDVGATA